MELPSFLANSPGIYVVNIDTRGKIIFSNQCFEEKFQNGHNSISGSNFTDLIFADDLPAFNKMLKTSIARRITIAEFGLKNGAANSRFRWECTRDDKAIICIGYNIHNDGKEEALANTVINSLPGIFYLQDEAGKYIKWNKNFETVSGYSADEMFTLDPLVLLDKKDHERMRKAVAKVFKVGHAEIDAEIVRRNKEIVPYFFNGRLIVYDGKNCLIGAGIDITEQTKVKNEITRSEKKYHSLFEQASDPIMITDFKGNFIDVNTNMCTLFGYTKKALLKMNIKSLIELDDLKSSPIRFDLLAEGQHIFSTRKMLHKSGTIVHVEANVKKFGENLVMAIARDVTELYKIQRQVEVSESTFRGAFENSPIGMGLNSPAGNWLRVNKQLCNITGYSEAEMLGMNFSKITHPDDLVSDLHHLKLCISGKTDTYRVEKRYFHKDGSVIWIKLNTTLVRDNTGKPLYFISQVEDITERRNTLEENDRIRYALNERVKELTALYRFSQALQDNKIPTKELLPKLVSILPPGWQYPEITAARIVFGKSEFQTSNFKTSQIKQQASFNTPDGTKVKLEVVYLQKKPAAYEGPFLKEERNLINMLADMFKTYLARKEESEALKKSEANLHSIFDATDTIYVLLDKKFRVISYNKPATDFAKREMNSVIKLNDPITNHIPKDRHSFFVKSMKKALKGEKIKYEIAYPQTDGSIKFYDTSILNVKGTAGEVFGLIVAVLDITETKLLEEKILKQNIQEQKKISRAIINAQEKERNHLGQELHDNVNQLLAGTKLHMRVAAQDNNAVKKLIRYPMQLIDSSIHEIRLLSSRQVTPLKNIRLKSMLSSLLTNWQKNVNIKIKFSYDIKKQTLGDDVKLNIYRIIQEQVNNITKYAKASNVSIVVVADNNKIDVIVSDDGIGFNVNKKRKGIGISNMINRVNAFNGGVIIESAAGKGCKIHAWIPLKD